MNENLYYTAPPEEQFNELKEKAIEVWNEIGSHPSYIEEKVGRVSSIGNISDNFMYMVAMFDTNNQRKLADKLSDETRKAVKERMLDGGNDRQFIVF